RRRPSRQHPGGILRTDRQGPQDLGRGCRGRRFEGKIVKHNKKVRSMHTPSPRPILIAGGGPVGVIAALAIARQGLPVQVFEAEAKVNEMPRAATTHAATLEMLAGLGMVEEVIQRGYVEPLFRIWDRQSMQIMAEFDFGTLKD